ncbi:hypothetical protein Cni_G23269 [Canna indica]|uniref:Uncharacterized protein n=1 Tax=Canna indica TaxID=4628 RepID=A0AAQ3QKB1_9LILI|nr:hypothetical protein Cni_G23269 [Canna indica]
MSDSSEFRKSRRGYRRLFSRHSSLDAADQSDEAVTTTRRTLIKGRPPNSTSSREIKAHPIIKILEAPSKKATAKPEFLRYLEYMKEAGSWEPNSDRPIIYFK